MSDLGSGPRDDRPSEAAFAPPGLAAVGPEPTAPADENTDALLVGVMADVRDLLRALLDRLDQLDRAIVGLPRPASLEPLDAKVVELGAALSSIATMLESLETAVHSGSAAVAPAAPAPGPAAGLVERVAAAGGSAGTNALLHARVEQIEQHVEATSAEIGRIKAQLDFIEEGIGYLATGLLGGGSPP